MCFLKLPFSEKLLSQCSHLKGFFPSFFKVQIFWEGRKVLQNLHLRFDAHYIESSVSWWFHKILWPQLHLKPHNYIHSSCTHFLVCSRPMRRSYFKMWLTQKHNGLLYPPRFFRHSKLKNVTSFQWSSMPHRAWHYVQRHLPHFFTIQILSEIRSLPSYLTWVNGQWFALNIEMHLWEKLNTV